MAVNLTPQYLEAEAEYKKARSAEDKLAALKKMWTLLPKHKASEKVQADLKTRMADLRDEIEAKGKQPKKGGPAAVKIPKQGAGQVVLLGGPNGGKSRLLSRLTRATPEVAPYPFTTRDLLPGMMDWEDVRIQLIDTPPITADMLETNILNCVRRADAAVLVVDLGDDDGPFTADAALQRLAEAKTHLIGERPEGEEDPTVEHVRTLLLGNKSDLPGAEDRLEIVREMFGSRFPIRVAAAEPGLGLDELKEELYKFLRVMRIYTKLPGKPPDMTSPYTCPEGSTVQEFAAVVHRDFADTLKSARVWGTGVFEGQTVKRDHVLHDKDVVELHV